MEKPLVVPHILLVSSRSRPQSTLLRLESARLQRPLHNPPPLPLRLHRPRILSSSVSSSELPAASSPPSPFWPSHIRFEVLPSGCSDGDDPWPLQPPTPHPNLPRLLAPELSALIPPPRR
ncbi:uncharacterized protein A4U43_C05F32220 [Asparagus officinalis]|uniref:Uncharacterized protein n=1 Tax=Asparagus officinalis TaxID=4686 RepID=A0A5P1F0P3_ASPOF|nr:uncharacterized protein A4U43_C05F32220 [Asparagus officinalis]